MLSRPQSAQSNTGPPPFEGRVVANRPRSHPHDCPSIRFGRLVDRDGRVTRSGAIDETLDGPSNGRRSGEIEFDSPNANQQRSTSADIVDSASTSRFNQSPTTSRASIKVASVEKGACAMYIGGGAVVIILVVILIVFLLRR